MTMQRVRADHTRTWILPALALVAAALGSAALWDRLGGPTPPARALAPAVPSAGAGSALLLDCPPPPSDLVVLRPTIGSRLVTDSPVLVWGDGAVGGGAILVGPDSTLLQPSGLEAADTNANGNFRVRLHLYPPSAGASVTIRVRWRPPEALLRGLRSVEGCDRTLATIPVTLEAPVPISVWVPRGPGEALPGPPFRVIVASGLDVRGVRAELRDAQGRQLAVADGVVASSDKGGIVYGARLTPHQTSYGPARLVVSWRLGASAAWATGLEIPVLLVSPQS